MISFIDVVNTIDDKNIPIGHGLKLLKDIPEILDEKVEILAGREYIERLEYKGKILPCSHHSGINKYISLKTLWNYFVSLIRSEGEILIYAIAIEPLLWGIALYKGKKKIVIISYDNWNRYVKNNLYNKPIRRFLVKRGLTRLEGCIVTNNSYRPSVPYVRLPDYYITNDFEKYIGRKKINGCICLGEIRYGKDIEGLVRVIEKTDISLLIAGVFQNRETYLKVKKYTNDNIRIENKNLSYEVYLDYLSTYKYVVLPYDIRYYDGRTSGVLLESIFMEAIPIAPKQLLIQNQVQGLGYENISEIPKLIHLYEEKKIMIENKLERYQLDRYKKKLEKLLRKIRKIG